MCGHVVWRKYFCHSCFDEFNNNNTDSILKQKFLHEFNLITVILHVFAMMINLLFLCGLHQKNELTF